MFEGVSFALGPGEALALLGPNGAGKSTLLRALADLGARGSGVALWRGRDGAGDPEFRAECAYLGHDDGLDGELSVAENLDFAAGLAGSALSEDDIARALEEFGVLALADRPAKTLSKGQRRRAALARLNAPPRPLWLLDEPSAGLDAASRARLEGAIARQRRRGGIVIAASHGDLAMEGARVLDFRSEAAK